MRAIVSTLVVIVFAAVWGVSSWKVAFSTAFAQQSAERHISTNEILDAYQKGARLSSHLRCENGNVSIRKYSAVNYTLLVMDDETAKNALYLFTDEQEALAGGSRVRQYFKQLPDVTDAVGINQKEWGEILTRMSPNFHKYIAKTQRKPSDTAPDSIFENDCRMVDVAQENKAE